MIIDNRKTGQSILKTQCLHPSIDSVRPTEYPCRPSEKSAQKSRRPNQVNGHETHLSAQQNQACSHAWLPCSHGHESRSPRSQAAPCKGPGTVNAVTLSATRTTTKYNPGFRFQKTSRLSDAAGFGRVFEKAARSRDKLFTVLCRRNDKDIARLGLAISKKNCRRATARNRIKRVIRESFRQHQALLSGLDLVVINQPAAASADKGSMSDSLERHWQRCSKQTRKRHTQES